MPQSYTEGGDTLQNLGGDNYAAQSFTPLKDFTLRHIDINLRNYHERASPTVWLYLADANHKPTGDYLSKYYRCYSDNWNTYNIFRMRADMSPVQLIADTEYVIVIHTYALSQDWYQQWQYDKDDATYERGIRLLSNDLGETWDAKPNDDHIFAVFGTPPVPPPPPPPPTTKWAILDIEQIITATGYKIIATTNVPCHLYFHWTNHEPLKHPQTMISRGLSVPAATKYCFVDWHQNEQSEPGDTIYHTFIKEPWAHCETRWFVFRGKIDNVWSPSISPIFKKHRYYVAPPWGPPQTVVFLGHVYDGYIATGRGHPFLTYPENWNAASGFLSTVEAALSLYNHDYNNTASIYRGVLVFDTSALPANCRIDSAFALLSVFNMVSDRSASLCLTPATTCHLPLINADYSALRDTPEIIASYPMDDMSDPDWDIELNLTEAGLDHITKASLTKFGARIDYEIAANPNSTCYEGIRVWNQEYSGTKPKLSVTYRLPL